MKAKSNTVTAKAIRTNKPAKQSLLFDKTEIKRRFGKKDFITLLEQVESQEKEIANLQQQKENLYDVVERPEFIRHSLEKEFRSFLSECDQAKRCPQNLTYFKSHPQEAWKISFNQWLKIHKAARRSSR